MTRALSKSVYTLIRSCTVADLPLVMDTGIYKELSYKIQGFRVVSWLIAAVSLLLCLLIGIGCYILVIGMHGKDAFPEESFGNKVTVIEGEFKRPANRIEAVRSVASEASSEDVQPVAHMNFASTFMRKSDPELQNIKQHSPVHPNSYKTSFSMRYPVDEIEQPSQESKEYIEQTLRLFDDFASSVNYGMDTKSEAHRFRRSVGLGFLGYMPYFSYLSFSKFLTNQLSEIASYNMESRSFQSRKLANDPVANFLDGVWPMESNQIEPAKPQKEHTQAPKPVRYEPLVNQVPLSFVAEILRTLLNLMKEFLMKDHVMECLWYMFCQDVNQQARHMDIYGILARVNRLVVCVTDSFSLDFAPH